MTRRAAGVEPVESNSQFATVRPRQPSDGPHISRKATLRAAIGSVAGAGSLVTDLLIIAPIVSAYRMRKRGRPIGIGVDDVVGELALLGIELSEMPDPFGDFVIGARRVAADPEPADSGLPFVERHATAAQ